MRIIVNILLCLSALFAVLVIGSLIYGVVIDDFGEGRGMTILVFELLGGLGSVGAILFGGISYAMGKKLNPQATGIGKTGVAFGVIGLATLAVMLAFVST